jgi:hypothetical protein
MFHKDAIPVVAMEWPQTVSAAKMCVFLQARSCDSNLVQLVLFTDGIL